MKCEFLASNHVWLNGSFGVVGLENCHTHKQKERKLV